ncbi:hypothetical protein KTR60_09980 [Rhodococcus sp. C1]|uniref:hypothetical protein n=1 Tax=Rhodococcus sp. C1 TaxID=644410 RepID=UPI001E5706EA|nr:hypothetical protein [Rhodococcus sp. C1]UEL35029.1 hypothetical protein KTR60_09980 [Rhodococcus sp. C1]
MNLQLQVLLPRLMRGYQFLLAAPRRGERRIRVFPRHPRSVGVVLSSVDRPELPEVDLFS